MGVQWCEWDVNLKPFFFFSSLFYEEADFLLRIVGGKYPLVLCQMIVAVWRGRLSHAEVCGYSRINQCANNISFHLHCAAEEARAVFSQKPRRRGYLGELTFWGKQWAVVNSLVRVRGAQLRSHVWLHALLRGHIAKTKGDIYTVDEPAPPPPPAAHLNRLVEGTIFGTSNIIFHSARDRKSVLISVCETHLQFMRETVRAEGKHTHERSHPYTHIRWCTPAENAHSCICVSR